MASATENNDLDLRTHFQDPRYRALFKLVHHRLGIPNIQGNELHILVCRDRQRYHFVIFNKHIIH